ncbi:MAG: cation:proton antiporter, partial [Ligilactobacillus sp.]|nr:cation:proton antiporter [Ligilactobacillus sp.]
MSYLLQLVIILLLTKLGAHLSNIFNFPSVIGELLVGVLAGPAVLNLLVPTTFTHYFAELGVIVLMFIAGLEGDLKALIHYWKPSLTVAILGVIVPTASAFLLCYYVFGFSAKTAIFLGLILSATSVSITVQVLREMQRLNSPEGSMILGAAVADDIICVILLGICVSLFGTTADLKRPIPLMLFLMLLFFALALILGKWFVPKFLSIFSRLNASENETTAALVLCFGFAFLAVSLGMSDVLG